MIIKDFLFITLGISFDVLLIKWDISYVMKTILNMFMSSLMDLIEKKNDRLMPSPGFEPGTFALQERRSRPLSYEGLLNMAPRPTRLRLSITWTIQLYYITHDICIYNIPVI